MKPLGPGARIADRYVLESVLAKGGMGAVYRAIDERLGRTVAIKVLLTELAEDETSLARFEREASASARLSHPAIVQTIDFGKHEGIPYIVMEHVVGRTLATELDQKRRIDPQRACDIVEQALGGIGAAHAAGIVHRDLKPGNIMLVPTGTGREVVKVLDFGIAQLKDTKTYARLTKSGAVLGTPTFMSPEQARGETSDPRTDVYAMGVVLWCCLTGQRPFEGPDVAAILGKVLNQMPPRADKINPLVPAAIAHATERAMEKRPSARYPTAAAFAQALIDAAEASTIPATAAVSLPPEPGRSRAPDDTRPVPSASASGSEAQRAAVTRLDVQMAPAPSAAQARAVAAPTASWHRWGLALLALVLVGGLVLGGLLVLGVLELESQGVALRPAPMPALPTLGPQSPVTPPPVVQQGAQDACGQLFACCEAFRRIQPGFEECASFVAQYQGALCGQGLLSFQQMFGVSGADVPAECIGR